MAAFQEWITLALQWSRVSLVTALALHAVLLWPTTTGAGQDTRCPWDQYYDDNVNNCGPCFEMCHAVEQTKTNYTCYSKCSDYLVSLSCQADQYYDEEKRSCASCAPLCSDAANNGTSQECLSKCHKFLERRQPYNREAGGLDVNIGPDQSSSSSSSSRAGVIATAVIGVLAVITIVGFALRRRSIERRAAAAHSVNCMESQPALPVPVSCEDVNAGDISLSLHTSAIAEANADNDALPEYGMAEIDPMAPSSAGGVFAHYSQHPSR